MKKTESELVNRRRNHVTMDGGSLRGDLLAVEVKGPDGVGDYRPKLTDFPHHIGVGPVSHEATGDLGYLWRAAPHAPPTTARHSYIGEVGWGWQYNQQLNQSTLLSNMQIKKTELRASLEVSASQKF
ncbi:protein SPMIP2 isoform X1 [Oryzias latipes]|uniref:Uncharacterized protein n=1 Tax=Oryzias latipes TaxID=8090 RepID=A0A3B3HYJ7_ORYLA